MKFISISILLLIPYFKVFAQETVDPYTEKYDLKITLGLDFWRALDNNASPLKYKSNQTELGFHFDYFTGRSVFTLGIIGSLGTLYPDDFRERKVYFIEQEYGGKTKTVSVQANGSLIGLKLVAGYHYITGLPGSKNYPEPGVVISESAFNPTGFTRPGLMNLFSLEPSFIYIHDFSGFTGIQLFGDFPLLSLVTRLPYNNTISLPGKNVISGFFLTGTKFSSLRNVQGIDTGMNIRFKMGNSVMSTLNYKYDWIYVKNPRSLNMSINSVSGNLFLLHS